MRKDKETWDSIQKNQNTLEKLAFEAGCIRGVEKAVDILINAPANHVIKSRLTQQILNLIELDKKRNKL